MTDRSLRWIFIMGMSLLIGIGCQSEERTALPDAAASKPQAPKALVAAPAQKPNSNCDTKALRGHLEQAAKRPLSDASLARQAAALVQETARQRSCFEGKPPLELCADLFRRPTSDATFQVMRSTALPALRSLYDDRLIYWRTNPEAKAPKAKAGTEDGLLACLEIMAVYGDPDDLMRLQQAARSGLAAKDPRWANILMRGMMRHPVEAGILLDKLSNPLPPAFIGASLLGLANRLLSQGKLQRHPLDNAAGLAQLQSWVEGRPGDNPSWRITAVSSLAGMRSPASTKLIVLAEQDPNLRIQMEAAWVRATRGQKKAIDKLADWAADPRLSKVACAYLQELGHAGRIPAITREDKFAAEAAFGAWLIGPNEFGAPPDKLEQIDMRNIAWPPTADQRALRVFHYTYPGVDGFGVTGGSFIFAMKSTEGPLQAKLENIYAMACCWELQQMKDPRGENCDMPRGMQLLGFNP
ncbi:MAG: hypothetical protein JRF33_21300 [Deltaproteobacteria bacterium]|nr:hypothetical protein [Deltaproteobacteria bacterium]